MNERMTIRDIAGFCPEEAIWKMLADVSDFLLKDGKGYVLRSDAIAIDGSTFMVEAEQSATTEAEMVWALGAVAYEAVMGHVVFGGHGESYQQQHPHVALPHLPKAFQRLTPIVHQCLCHDEGKRIGLKDLSQQAHKGLETCRQEGRETVPTTATSTTTEKRQREKWPEEMREV